MNVGGIEVEVVTDDGTVVDREPNVLVFVVLGSVPNIETARTSSLFWAASLTL